jgi:NADPH-dependent curcumin reductase CurA
MQNSLLYRKPRSFASRRNCLGWRPRASQRLSSQASTNSAIPSWPPVLLLGLGAERAHGKAFQALVLVGDVRRGDDVLVHAAASGVGIAAIQLARFYGA